MSANPYTPALRHILTNLTDRPPALFVANVGHLPGILAAITAAAPAARVQTTHPAVLAEGRPATIAHFKEVRPADKYDGLIYTPLPEATPEGIAADLRHAKEFLMGSARLAALLPLSALWKRAGVDDALRSVAVTRGTPGGLVTYLHRPATEKAWALA